jgi:hypothetical protein
MHEPQKTVSTKEYRKMEEFKICPNQGDNLWCDDEDCEICNNNFSLVHTDEVIEEHVRKYPWLKTCWTIIKPEHDKDEEEEHDQE